MKNFNENQFYDLLSLKLSGDASAEELQHLELCLQQNKQWQFLYDQMLAAPQQPDYSEAEQAFAAHSVKLQLQKENIILNVAEDDNKEKSKLKRFILPTLIAAASICFLFYLFINNNNNNPKIPNEILTKKGSKSNIKLPDGSKVWLNADSKLTFTENFGKANREVTLIGEAFFDVAHDEKKPFIIHTGKADIKVLGTAFNVRNYPTDKTTETTLIRGKIEVTLFDRPDEKIILLPKEKLLLSNENNFIPEKKSNTNNEISKTIHKVVVTSATYKDSLQVETSWVNDKLVFVNQPFEKITQDLERKFAFNFLFKTNSSKQFKYTGVFENESIYEILKIIKLSKKISYTIKNKTIILD
jgi:transmembrane sensor